MKAIRTSPQDAQETPCPACGAPISTTSIGRRRRVQCPKCREIVELTAESKIATRPAELFDEPQSPLEKISALEARVAALEAAASATASLQPLQVVVQRPERKWKWLAHSNAHEAEKLPTEVSETLLQNLANYDGSTIEIQSAEGNARAASRAASFKEIFDRAQWTVTGPSQIAVRSHESGLFLAVGGLPLPLAADAAYFSMTTSGFAVQSFLDPRLRSDETILIVA